MLTVQSHTWKKFVMNLGDRQWVRTFETPHGVVWAQRDRRRFGSCDNKQAKEEAAGATSDYRNGQRAVARCTS